MIGDSVRLQRLDAQAARRWAVATRSAFAVHRAEIDDLNVFPVPDGDTGTNLYITLDSALAAAREPHGLDGSDEKPRGCRPGAEGTLAEEVATMARETLLAARGNSGVILSQLVRGLSEVIAEEAPPGPGGEAGAEGIDAPMLARAVRRASDRAYASVTRPVEGTILTVAAAAASAAEVAATTGSDLYAVACAALTAARTALAATTAQLPVLARAGVVDAGGVGYVLVLEALELVVSGALAGDPVAHPRLEGATNLSPANLSPANLSPAALRAAAHAHEGRGGSGGEQGRGGMTQGDLDEDVWRAGAPHHDGNVFGPGHAGRKPGALPYEAPGALACEVPGASSREVPGAPSGQVPGAPSYEVMYLLSESDEEAVARLRGRLDGLGDSVLVVGGEDLWNVHVHVDDVGAAIQAGIQAGRPHRIVVTHFGDQQRARTARSARGTVAVVACAAGEGLAEVFRAAGAVPVFNGPGRRASAGQLLDAIRSAGSRCVIVLPNEKDTQLAAEAAASAAAGGGLDVQVVRSWSAVQGIAALAVFEPAASGRDNLIAMSEAAAATRQGAVTVASRASLTSGGRCHPGDVLGTVDGEVVVVGSDLAVVGAQVVACLLAGGGELLTVISGAGSAPEISALVAQSARAGGREVEVSIIDGGQTTYPLLLGVE